jgi:membrane protease YdiL (CAAX protease family)
VEPTLPGSLAGFALFALIVFGIGGLRGRDVGWKAAAIGPAVLVTLGVWLAMQVVFVVMALRDGTPLALHEAWTVRGAGYVLGGLLAQLLGNALVEETEFQGFFLRQFFHKAKRGSGELVALALALIGSPSLFALVHVPNRVFIKGLTGQDLLTDLAGTAVLGLLFAVVYLVTGNLFVSVGIHALRNAPTPLVQAPDGRADAVWFGLTVALVVGWALGSRIAGTGNGNAKSGNEADHRQ